ncbi:MAG: hypothetical protein KF802_03085 [Bdellovibrionaceae bacterium]|nr:hypothetical protein [Pseudobdellovibrionaceae bacterium]MBX3033395.1 hypothetical protein [Pseudobdellovibrionaceae bacterium]
MKNTKHLLLALTALLAMGCSNKFTAMDASSGSIIDNGQDWEPQIPPGDGGGGSGAAGSNKVTFVPVSFEEMNSYVAIRPLNYPTDYTVQVDLQNDGTNLFSGSVRIGYTDNNMRYEGVFLSGTGVNNKIEYNNYNYLKEYQHNFWFQNSSKFTGYFQDSYGAIVLVIDSVSSQGNGDGLNTTVLGGSIWYRNFPASQAPQSPYRKCWHVEGGPFDCRSWAVSTKAGVEPTDTYRKLGTFSGLSLPQAFK